MGSSRVYKYSYRVFQTPHKVRIDLFGRDTKLSNAQLEEMRQKFNADGANVTEIELVLQRTGNIVASSSLV